jgi:hypothetical protein
MEADAAAEAASGRMHEAVAMQTRALAVWREREDAAAAARAEEKLEEYRRGVEARDGR